MSGSLVCALSFLKSLLTWASREKYVVKVGSSFFAYRIVSYHRVLWMAVVDVLIVQKRNLSSESAGFN